MSHWARAILEEAVWSKKTLPRHVVDGLNRLVEHIEGSDVYQFRICELGEIADQISVCDNLSNLAELTWRGATSAGFQDFSIFVICQGRSPAFASRMCASYNQDWLHQYQAKSYQFVDPVVTKARSYTGSFSFAEAENNDPMTEEFWQDARRHRVGRNGLCYVVERPNGARVGVSFSSKHTRAKTDELIRLNGYDLKSLAQVAVECFVHVSAGQTLDENTLTADELKFLHILSTSSIPERALFQTPSFGGNKALQASIRKKLNVASIFQAISIASSMKWFDNLPIYAEEVVSSSPKLSGWEISDIGDSG